MASPKAFGATLQRRLGWDPRFRMIALPNPFSLRRLRPISRAWVPGALGMCLAVSGAPNLAQAHHSFAMYDQTKVVTLNGTVKDFQWSNPHALVWLLVPSPTGDAVLWSIELPTGPGNLARVGWSKHSLNPGDKVAVDINPLRDGRNGGSLKKVLLVDSGKVLVVGAFATAKP